MKKLFVYLLLFASTNLLAKENITVIYPFSAADTMANWGRVLVEEANTIQTKYNFLFDVRPGAGNAIAANYVLNTPNTILYTSSAFFIRPNLFPKESYNIEDFKEIVPLCNAPLAVSSSQYQLWADVPANQLMNIGTSGLGVTTHLIAMQIITKYPGQLQVIPYKSTTDAMLSLASKEINFAVSFMGEAVEWTSNPSKKKINILGITGNKIVNGYKPLSEQGFPKILSKMSASHHLVVSKKMNLDQTAELQEILVAVANRQQVHKSYESDFCVPIRFQSNADVQVWFNEQIQLWKSLSSTVQLDR